MMTLRTTLQQKLPELAAIILIAVAASSIWAAGVRDREGALVEHTLEVQNAIGSIETALIEAQSGNRGFIITGQDSYLDPYHNGLKALQERTVQLERLVSDNAEQTATLEALKGVISARLERLAAGIEVRRKDGLEAATAYVQTHNGAELMRAAREHVTTLRNRETELLDLRRAAEARADWRLTLANGMGVLLAIAVAGLWISRLRRTARALEENIAERNAAEAQVRQLQKMEAVGQLTGGIAHDFNNMLAVIISALTLLQKRLSAGDTAQVPKLVDAALDGAHRAATLTKRLTAFSRQQALTPQPINCNKFVAGLSDLIERTIGGEIKIETVLGGGLWLTNVDPGQLENAVLNLAVNARDAMPSGGKITIETSNAFLDERYGRMHGLKHGQYVLVALSDTGAGMPEDVIARAFDPFFTTKEVGKGTGLGLSQVHGFVRQSGGHVKIYSEPGAGTTVKIYLPRFYGADDGVAAKAGEAKPAQRLDAGRYTILVVEDDDKVRASSTALLRELGYNVLEAPGAREALDILAKRSDVSLLFTDIVMPEVNGRKLADEATSRWPHLKVLFTTGFTRNAIVHHGVLDPGVELIAKPFTLAQLEEKVGAIIADIPTKVQR
jgi:signal transduction histidine kinase/ActR/RegA family two-component response regulator